MTDKMSGYFKGKKQTQNVNVDAFSEPEWECNTTESSDST